MARCGKPCLPRYLPGSWPYAYSTCWSLLSVEAFKFMAETRSRRPRLAQTKRQRQWGKEKRCHTNAGEGGTGETGVLFLEVRQGGLDRSGRMDGPKGGTKTAPVPAEVAPRLMIAGTLNLLALHPVSLCTRQVAST